MLALEHVSKAFKDKRILNDISVVVSPGDVIALIGDNGVGKTTLLRILCGELQPDAGIVQRQGEAVGYAPQNPALGIDIQTSFPSTQEPWRIDRALEIVQLSDKPQATPTASLSGGQKTRLAIAAILANDVAPSVLLLDEPTNNLDAEGLAWLKAYIRSFSGGVMFVSHDRSFIDAVATRIVELDKGALRSYSGNYEQYLAQKALEQQHRQDIYDEAVKKKAQLQRSRRQKTSMMQRSSAETFDKVKHESKMGFQGKKDAAERTLGKQLRSLDTQLKDLSAVERPKTAAQYDVSLAGDISAAKRVLRLRHVRKTYDTLTIDIPDIEIYGSERMLVVGPNGSGKTTLLKLAAGLLTPDSGTVTKGTEISIGYFSQDVDSIDQDRTGFENLAQTSADNTAIYRQARALGIVPADLQRTTHELSRGQQAKLSFAQLLLASHQLLVLDEPTNHLDISIREGIESALQAYKGALLVASHDTHFIAQLGITRTLSLASVSKR